MNDHSASLFASRLRSGFLGICAAFGLAGTAFAGPQETEAGLGETIGEAMLSEGTGTQEGLSAWLPAFKDRALAAGGFLGHAGGFERRRIFAKGRSQ